MSKDKDETNGRFVEGNKASEKFNEAEAHDIFSNCYQVVKQGGDSYLSMDDVILYAKDELGVGSSTFYHLIKKFPDLEHIKKDIMRVIRSRINRKSLNGDFSAAPSIWRLKQLGERDPDKQEQTDVLKTLKFNVTQS